MSLPNSPKKRKGNSSHSAHDARLVESTRNGDHNAFGDLVIRYENRLYRVIFQFIRENELTKDLTQETFLRAFEKLNQFDSSRRFGPWLFRIGVNLTLDYLRKRKRRGWLSLFSESPSERAPDPMVADPRQALDLKQEVRAVLDQIPENYRAVIILRDLENFSTSEIAAILDRKETTIRWRLAEARKRFEKLWSAREASELGMDVESVPESLSAKKQQVQKQRASKEQHTKPKK